jgi:molybdopterin-guanine dinucleotide biosynthesis protein A
MRGMEVARPQNGDPRGENSFTAVLLAGGRSSRMGAEKAALVLAREPLWRRQVATLQALGPHELLVSGPKNGPFTEVEVVEDAWPGQGPLGALATVFPRVRSRWVVVLAIDLPLVTAAFLRGLLAETAQARSGLVPWEEDRFHPLAAVYPAEAGALAQERVEAGELALQPFVRELEQLGLVRRRELTAAESALLRNLNTPADWAELTRELH